MDTNSELRKVLASLAGVLFGSLIKSATAKIFQRKQLKSLECRIEALENNDTVNPKIG
jgi:hypothetical protein